MGLQRDYGWGSSEALFEPLQVESILTELGVAIRSQTETNFIAECPFHTNMGTPAFTINKTTGLFFCHNPSCAASGTLTKLVSAIRDKGELDAKKFIRSNYVPIDYVSVLERLSNRTEVKEFSQDTIDRLVKEFPGSPGEEYMLGRGFTKETLQEFQIGYSAQRGVVTVPMYDEKGMPVGLVTRSVSGKQFGSSKGLPKSMSAWNMHRAKRHGGTLIIVESSFDAMRVHQAGHPNVVALLGGHLSTSIKEQLEIYASTLIIMTDNDGPGRKLGNNIEQQIRRRTLWAAEGPDIYPHGAKDACDLTEQEISNLLYHAVSGVEYHMWTD